MSSKQKVASPAISPKPSEANTPLLEHCCTPDFIYGGPFIKVPKPDPFLNISTPVNIQLQGTFKKSFAYYSLKERLPVILTKVIDYLSRSPKAKASGGTDEDIRAYIQYVSKLKNDLVTNKEYDLFTIDTPDAKKWNEWIQNQENKHYFTNVWIFTECYVYRRLREGAELRKSLQNIDPFDEQKEKSFENSLHFMCLVADKLVTMLPPSEKDKKKADFMTLLKICLWANKCDLSLSVGEEVTLGGGKAIDPFQMILDFKDKLLVDDSGKAFDVICTKAENMLKSIEGPPLAVEPSKTAPRSPPASVPPSPPGEPAEGEEPPKIPCPAKMVIPQTVMFDIVCDNAGYELFADLCFAHFLISQKIVQKIRFHVKNMPWFVSDVTLKDFKYVIDSCMKANYNKTIEPEPKPAPSDGEPPEPEPSITVTSENLKNIAEQWNKYVEDGTFLVMAEDFWTYPHVYKDMKKYDYNMYRKLQLGVAIMFKGDLNYRKLLGEKKWNPYIGFEASLQGFIPAPVLAVRTVKADLISGMPKGKFEQLNKIDEKWMEKGDYGVIQFCGKAEPLKVSDRPCIDYCKNCFGDVCPTHEDM